MNPGTWVEVSGKGAVWTRRAFHEDQTGIVYLPGVISGNEQMAVLCAGFDGVDVVIDRKHFYFPSKWMKQEYPKLKKLIELAERRILEAVAPSCPGENERTK